ncbi:MAG: peptide ABC transporter substrate-binding protein [Spirochaetaceae bacterium]|jgi:peptide/nickel transport system substrate-binding protein/oligopeptide transport system substrate-binding protein|nr:peptide ABC transporter substrate-binding protein [Spirochaetaceae bacterium]
MRRISSFFIIFLFFISCATFSQVQPPVPETEGETETETEGEPDAYAETRPEVVDRHILTVAFPKTDIEFDYRNSYLANEAQVYTALYEGLFSYHPLSINPMPGAASKWVVSDDKKEWTFTIRDYARYWNGDPVRAEDFRAAWLSVLDPDRNSPYSSLFDIIEGARDFRLGRQKDASKVGIAAPDDTTLVVRLVSPATFFPAMLCHHSFSPIHPSMLAVKDWSASPPISNGPFYLLQQDENELVLARNELYWDARDVNLSKIIIKWTEDGDAASELWNSGEVRWLSGNFNLEKIKDRSGLAVNPIFATYYYYIRSARKPWNDYHVRRALSLALPWEKLREGYYLPAKTLVYPITGYPEIEGLDNTDIEQAKKLLLDAGFPAGQGLPELVFRVSPGAEAERIGGIMASVWKEELGIKVKIEVVPFGAYFDSLKEDNYDVGFSTWIGDFADPYTFLQMWRRDSNLNDARHNDSEYEKLLDRSMSEEGESRLKTLSEAEELLLTRGNVLPISYSFAVNIVDTGELDGWYRNVLDIHPFKYLKFRPQSPLPSVAGTTGGASGTFSPPQAVLAHANGVSSPNRLSRFIAGFRRHKHHRRFQAPANSVSSSNGLNPPQAVSARLRQFHPPQAVLARLRRF